MRVVVPFTNLRPQTAAALDATGHAWEAVDVSGSDDACWQLLSDLWRTREGFIWVEHDIVVHPTALQELEECGSAWCGFYSPYFVGNYPGMGCVKFSAGLTASVPDALDRVATMSDASHSPKHWCRLDAWLQYVVLPQARLQRHLHLEVLGHVRDYEGQPQPSHGCVA